MRSPPYAMCARGVKEQLWGPLPDNEAAVHSEAAGGEVVVGPSHGLARRLGAHLVPPREVGAPLVIQCSQGSVVLTQPDTHRSQRPRRQIKVPEGRKIGDACLVTQAIIQRIVTLLFAYDRHEPIADALLPHRIDEAWIAP